MCPGTLKFSLVDLSLHKPLTVLYLSSADIPVVTPSPLKSTDAVNCVSVSLLTPDIKLRLSFFATSVDIGAHTNPFP